MDHVAGGETLPAIQEPDHGAVEPLLRLTADIIGAPATSAPIRMPNRDELTVRLVNVDKLQRLDELRDDVTVMQTVCGTATGGLLGFLANVFTTTSHMDAKMWIFLGLLGAVVGVSMFLTRRVSKRASDLRARIFDDTAA